MTHGSSSWNKPRPIPRIIVSISPSQSIRSANANPVVASKTAVDDEIIESIIDYCLGTLPLTDCTLKNILLTMWIEYLITIATQITTNKVKTVS